MLVTDGLWLWGTVHCRNFGVAGGFNDKVRGGHFSHRYSSQTIIFKDIEKKKKKRRLTIRDIGRLGTVGGQVSPHQGDSEEVD